MFLVCGEALLDVFSEHDTPGGVALDARVGGSPFNVAIGLAQGFTSREAVRIEARAVQVVDAVGAGDTFQAALLAWLAEHGLLSIDAVAALSAQQLRTAMEFAAGAAAITCTRRGADMPRRAEL